MLLVPSEEGGMIARLKEKGVVVERIKVKESKVGSIENQLQNLAFQDPEVKYLGQKVRFAPISLHLAPYLCSSIVH